MKHAQARWYDYALLLFVLSVPMYFVILPVATAKLYYVCYGTECLQQFRKDASTVEIDGRVCLHLVDGYSLPREAEFTHRDLVPTLDSYFFWKYHVMPEWVLHVVIDRKPPVIILKQNEFDGQALNAYVSGVTSRLDGLEWCGDKVEIRLSGR